ncbi:acyl-CoA dehydrogenase family protein [Nocardia aobensis]|uniref:acyl-CoA dehydrogenase family protein n=1 Tax=Nocardia aobensis TaxID=257277 RepID=UPI000684EF31|nr:acyl-CoA dehydrogenase family protein [Nocardia aobensis]
MTSTLDGQQQFERALRDSARRLFRSPHWLESDQLLGLGWSELVAEDPKLAIRTLGEEHGRELARSRTLELAVRAGAALPESVPATATSVIVLPSAGTIFDEGTSKVVGLGLGRPLEAGTVLLPVAGDNGTQLLELPDTSVRWLERGLLDGRPSMLAVEVDLSGTTNRHPCNWRGAVRYGRLYLTAEYIGLTAKMLELACDHVRVRHQFARPLGSFQAVQQRLANVRVRLEAAYANQEAAWRDPHQAYAAAALLSAREAFESAVSDCVQVMGAIACTWEHPIHAYVRRGVANSVIFPDEAGLADAWHGLEHAEITLAEVFE